MRLLELLQPGDKVYGTVTKVAKSGMSRHIDFHIYRNDGDDPRNPRKIWITPFVGDLIGCRWSDLGVYRVGCGMDMVFDSVYNLGWALWPHGAPCIGKGCQSNDHHNPGPLRDDYTPHGHRGPQYDGTPESLNHIHRDSGYALRQA